MKPILNAARVVLYVTLQTLLAQDVAFVDVSVIPMDSERIIKHQTVLIRGDRIAAIGPAAQLRVPSSSIKVDGRGKFLMPGLADMHVHFFMGSMRTVPPLLLVANGVTTARSMSGSPEVLSLKKEIEDGQLVGPRIYSSGSVTDGNPPAYPGSRVVVTAKEAKHAVEQDKTIPRRKGSVAFRMPGSHDPDHRSSARSDVSRYGGIEVASWRFSFRDILRFSSPL